MLKLMYIELFLRAIPESLIFVFSGYALSRTVVNLKNHVLSSTMLTVVGYFIRLLPIHFGVHSILALITLIILLVSINKIDLIKAVSASIITFILGFMTEGIDLFLIQIVLKVDTKVISQDPVLKILYGIPSLVILGTIVGCYYIILLKLNKLRKV